MRRRRLFPIAVTVIGAAAAACFLLWPSTCPISREGLRALRPGMAEAEVNELLGVPPGDYTSGPVSAVNPPLGGVGTPPGMGFVSKRATWSDDRTKIEAEYD